MGRRHVTLVLTRVITLLAGIALLVPAGCSDTTGPGSSQSAPAPLVVGATLEPTALDITTADGAGGPQALLYNVYETLVKIGNDGSLVGLLSTDWTVSPDGRTYTFALQPHATFANGDPVTAQAVVDSLNHIRDNPATTATIKSQLAVVKDAAADDAGTVTITLKQRSHFWLYNMAGPAGIVIDPSRFSTVNQASAGSGPYVFKSWNKGDSLTLTRNTNYWGNEAHFASVRFKYFTDPNALTTAMKAGDVNIISDLTTPEALGQFTDASKYTIVRGTTNGEVVMGFNHDSAPLKNLKVRRAILYGVDRKALLDSVWGGQGTLIGSMVPPTDPYYEDLSGYYPYDPARAKQLLKEAGYGKGLTLSMPVPNLSYATGSAQFVAAQLKQVGITVKVQQQDFGTWISQVFQKGDYDLTVVNHVEPKDIVKWADKNYYWHYDNPRFNKLIAAADQAPTDDEFVSLMKQAALVLTTDAAADFLFLFPHIAVSDADISGITPNAVTSSFDLTTLASRNG